MTSQKMARVWPFFGIVREPGQGTTAVYDPFRGYNCLRFNTMTKVMTIAGLDVQMHAI
jgi:hypothetical protein